MALKLMAKRAMPVTMIMMTAAATLLGMVPFNAEI